MPRLVVENISRELTGGCSWTSEQVDLSSGDLYIDGVPFGTYFAASYPESRRPPHFIINVVDPSGKATLSVPFEYSPKSAQALLPLPASASPWGSDGVLVGPIPGEQERVTYTRVAEVLKVARDLVLVEPNLASYQSEA